MDVKEIEIQEKVYSFKDELARLKINLLESKVITKIDSPTDYEGEFHTDSNNPGYILWPTPFKLIIYIDYWQDEDPEPTELGLYCYHPEERYLYYTGTLNDNIIWLDMELMPEILYIYNNEGYKLSKEGYYLEKILGDGSGTKGKVYEIVASDNKTDIDYSKLKPGQYINLQDTAAKYLGNGEIDTNIEDGTFFVYNNILYISFENGYISEVINANDYIPDLSITKAKLANKTITSDKIADKTITKNQIADMTIEGSNIQHATITGHHIASGTIDGEHIINKSITGNNIADQTITGDKLVNGTITNNKIQAGAIGEQEIAEGGVKGYNIGEEEITAFHLSSGCVGADAIGNKEIYSSHIADKTITENLIKNGSVTNAILADNSITTNKIKSSAITSDKLANYAVTTSKIDDDCITEDKIVNYSITEDKIANDAIVADKIKDGEVLTNKLANNCITTSKIVNYAVTTNKIDDDSITEDKLVNYSVTEDKIASNAIVADKIKNGEITADKLANNSVTSNKLVNYSVTTSKIGDECIIEDKLANYCVTEDKIANDSITADKIINNTITDNKLVSKFVKKIKINNSVTEYSPDSNGIVNIPITGGSGEGVDQGALDVISNRINTLETRIETNETNLNTQSLSISDLQTDIQDLGDSLQSSINSNTSNISRIGDNVNTLLGNVTTLLEDVTTLQENIGTLLEDISNLNQLESDIGTFSNTVNNINGNIENLQDNVTSINNRIDNLASTVGSITGSDYSGFEIINKNTASTINSETFKSGKKYRILSNLTISGNNYTFPDDVTLLFDGGAIITGGANATITGNNTKIIDTTNQIFEEKVSCIGNWNIPFSRPEWWGAKADGTDYGSWPFRVYKLSFSSNSQNIHLDEGTKLDLTIESPDVYFNNTPYEFFITLSNNPNISEALRLKYIGVVPEYTGHNVYYDNVNNCFYFYYNNTYYKKWKNSYDYNDPVTGKARTDCVYICTEKVTYSTENDTESRTFAEEVGDKTAAHIFSNDYERIFIDKTSKNASLNNYDYDVAVPFDNALRMTNGNIKLLENGVYVFKTPLPGEYNYIKIDDSGDNPLYYGTFEGNNATLFMYPCTITPNPLKYPNEHSAVRRGFFISLGKEDREDYNIQNLKISTVKALSSDNESSTYRTMDFATSGLYAFFISLAEHLIISNVDVHYAHHDFLVKYEGETANLNRTYKGFIINNWNSYNSCQPMYRGINVEKVEINNSNILIRPYGQPGLHIFYVMHTGLNRQLHIVCNNCKFYVPDGFTSDPISIRGVPDDREVVIKSITVANNGTVINAWNYYESNSASTMHANTGDENVFDPSNPSLNREVEINPSTGTSPMIVNFAQGGGFKSTTEEKNGNIVHAYGTLYDNAFLKIPANIDNTITVVCNSSDYFYKLGNNRNLNIDNNRYYTTYTITVTSDDLDNDGYVVLRCLPKVDYLKNLHTVELNNCEFTGHRIGTIGLGNRYYLNGLKYFYKNSKVVGNLLDSVLDLDTVLTNESGIARIYINNSNFHLGDKGLYISSNKLLNSDNEFRITNSRIESSKDYYTESADTYGNALICTSGSIYSDNCTVIAPKAPVFSLSRQVFGCYNKVKSFIANNIVGICGGAFFIAFLLQLFREVTIKNCKLAIAPQKLNINPKTVSTTYMATLLQGFSSNNKNSYNYTCTLANTTLIDNEVSCYVDTFPRAGNTHYSNENTRLWSSSINPVDAVLVDNNIADGEIVSIP